MSQQDEKTATSPARPRHLTKSQRRIALVFAGFPLGLWLILFVLNPSYPSALFAESCGLAMVGTIIILVIIGYTAVLGSFALANKLEPPGWFMHKKTWRLLLPGCVIVLFIFPALYLVLLGPAVLVLMRSGVFDNGP